MLVEGAFHLRSNHRGAGDVAVAAGGPIAEDVGWQRWRAGENVAGMVEVVGECGGDGQCGVDQGLPVLCQCDVIEQVGVSEGDVTAFAFLPHGEERVVVKGQAQRVAHVGEGVGVADVGGEDHAAGV